MKLLFVALALALFSLAAGGPRPIYATDECPHHEATIQSLRACVQHAASEGFITNAGVARSLLAKLNAAQAALQRDNRPTAINLLNAFVTEVRAQAGRHIDSQHAEHMIMHAQEVIEALNR